LPVENAINKSGFDGFPATANGVRSRKPHKPYRRYDEALKE